MKSEKGEEKKEEKNVLSVEKADVSTFKSNKVIILKTGHLDMHHLLFRCLTFSAHFMIFIAYFREH